MKITPITGRLGSLTAQLALESGNTFFLHSLYNPQVEAERWATSNLQHYNEGPIFVIGLGLGYHIEALARLRPDKSITILEGQPQLVQLIKGRADWQFPSNCDLQTAYEKESYIQKLNYFIETIEKTNGTLLIHRPSILALPRDWRDIKEIIENYMMRLDTIQRFNELAQNNWEHNKPLALNSLGIEDLKKCWSNKPNLVVGSGPSLLADINQLRQWAKAFNIIAVGSAVSVLLTHEIRPDIQMFLDPQEQVAKQITNASANLASVVFATAHPVVLAHLKGPVYWAWQEGFEWHGEGKGPYLPTGGTVVSAALALAWFLNEQPVLLLGVDLAYWGERSHAAGTMYGEIKTVLRDMRYVDSVEGSQLKTSRNLDYYRRRIEDMIASHKGPVYNLGRGAKIKGAQAINWAQVQEILI